MNRFQESLVSAAVTGILLGATGCTTKQGPPPVAPGSAPAAANTVAEKHVCKGQNTCRGKGADGKNDCAGKGTCATAYKHDCGGKNECRGQGGCGGKVGKNDCAGKGGCAVPVKH